jgi:ketosteroid isomerase-like protein
MTTATRHDTETLTDIRRAAEAAENAGDAEFIAGLFAEDAVLMVPDFPIQDGGAACAEFIRGLLPGLLSAFDRRVAYTSAEVIVLGETALDRGSFTFTVRPKGGGATERVTGKYLWMYTRSATDAWKWSRVIMSRDEREDLTGSERPSASTRLSANLALPFAIFLALAEIVRNWGAWGFWPFWLVDYIAVALLLTAWQAWRRGRDNAPVLLAGAWGFTCAMFYMSFFLHLAQINTPDRGPITHPTLTWIIGLLFAATVVGLVGSLVGIRPRRDLTSD